MVDKITFNKTIHFIGTFTRTS